MVTSLLNDVITTVAMQNSRHQLELVCDMNLKILLENSLKFTEEGGIGICVEFRRESYGINLVIDIYDTGIGMTHSQITQMCNEFYQAESGSSRFAGGLGI